MNYLQKLIKESLQGYQLKKKIGCSCGCNTCGDKAPILNENKAPRSILSEGLKYCIDTKKPLTENLYRAGSEKYFNLWSEARALYSRGIIDIKNQDDLEILTETQLGEFGVYEGKKVPLDFIMEEIEEELNETVTGPDKDFVLSIMQYLESQGKLDSNAKKTLFSYMNSPSGNREGVLAILKALESKLEMNEAEGKKKTPPIGKPKRGGSKKFYVYVRKKGGGVKKVSFGQAGMSAKINNSKARAAFSKRHDCPNKKDRTKASYWSCRLPRYAHLLGLKSKFSGFW